MQTNGPDLIRLHATACRSASPLVLDCRFLPNPHGATSSRLQAGRDNPVPAMSSKPPDGIPEALEGLFDVVLPGFVAEGKSSLTIAVGSTGDVTSVVIAESSPDACASGGSRRGCYSHRRRQA